MRKPSISVNELLRLRSEMRGGSEAARSELVSLRRSMAKRANTRLTALEKKDYDYYSYDKAAAYATSKYGKARFSTKKVSDEDLYKDLLQIRKFLESKSSTLTGQREIEKKKAETYREMGFDFDDKEMKKFLKFLGDEDIRGIIKMSGKSKYGGHSGEIIDAIRGQWKSNVDLVKIRNLFREYASDKIGYDELLEGLQK